MGGREGEKGTQCTGREREEEGKVWSVGGKEECGEEGGREEVKREKVTMGVQGKGDSPTVQKSMEP